MVDLPLIIAFDNNNWFGDMANRQQLLSRLAGRGWPVIYSNGAADLWTRGSAPWRRAGLLPGAVHADGVIIERPGRLLPRWRTRPMWDAFALRRHAAHIARLAGRHDLRDTVAFFFNPTFLPYLRALGSRRVAFHVRDVFPELPGWTDGAQQQYETLARRADLLTVPAPAVVNALPAESRDKAKLLLNAADAGLFHGGKAQACPPELAVIPLPRIGYIGAVSLKFDFALVTELARRRPSWQWVLIGTAPRGASGSLGGSSNAEAEWQRLQALPNVHYMGSRPYPELPAYVAHMTVNTMPYQLGAWAKYAYPLKLNEYLATGAPVVSCDLPDLRPLRHILASASGADEWEQALEHAIEQGGVGTATERETFAFENDWDARAEQLDAWIRALN